MIEIRGVLFWNCFVDVVRTSSANHGQATIVKLLGLH